MHTATAGPHWQGVSTRVPSGTGRPGEAPLSDTSKHHLVKTKSTLDIILLSVMRRVKSILIQSHGGYEHPFVLGALTDFKSTPLFSHGTHDKAGQGGGGVGVGELEGTTCTGRAEKEGGRFEHI